MSVLSPAPLRGGCPDDRNVIFSQGDKAFNDKIEEKSCSPARISGRGDRISKEEAKKSIIGWENGRSSRKYSRFNWEKFLLMVMSLLMGDTGVHYVCGAIQDPCL
jgi:hypothetical protein